MDGARRTGAELTPDDQDAINANLSWKDLTVVVNNTKTILHNLSGVAEPGRLLAIMGPSGSGKSSMLDTLAGRPSTGATVTGQILLNGHKAKLAYGNAAYLAQDVVLLGTLTVFETIYYSAKLRFPDRMSDREAKHIVNNTIADMGLNRCIDTPIGSWYRRGISGGEKRRVSIAIELLTSPRLLFLDEPTSGLDRHTILAQNNNNYVVKVLVTEFIGVDSIVGEGLMQLVVQNPMSDILTKSASAFHVVSTLKTLASRGRTVISSIHQPSSEVFDLFDDLCLLSTGRQVYFGPLPGALEFFASAGIPCPPFRNPSDHYLHSINSDFDDVYIILKESGIAHIKSNPEDDVEEAPREAQSTAPLRSWTAAEAVISLLRAFAASKEKQDLDSRIQGMTKLKGKELDSKGSQASFVRQSYILTRRSFINMWRDVGYYWLRLAMYIVLTVALGTIFYKVGYRYTAIQARAACLLFVVAFLGFMAVGGFPSFIEDMKVFFMERLNGHYGVGAFVLGNTISSMPFLFLISLVSSIITYFLVNFHSGGQYFIYFVLSLYASVLAIESLMMAIACLVPNFLMGTVFGAAIQGMYVLVGGFFRLPNDLPKPIWRYPMYYISLHNYSYQGMLQNDLKGLTFENINPADPKISGEYILRHIFQVQESRSKWWDLAILFLMVVVYRTMFYCCIRFSETTLPVIRVFISKKFSPSRPNRLAAAESDQEFPNSRAT